MSFLAVPGIISQGGAAWTPASLSPEGWWRADLGHAAADTDPIASWANQGTAGSALDLVQASGPLQPLYDASHATFNNQPVIDFGAQDYVLASATTTAWHLSSESSSMAVIAVLRCTSASGTEDVIGTRNAGTVGGFRLIHKSAAACSFQVDESGGVATITDTGGSGTQNALHVLAGVLTGAVTTTHDSAACWLDGVSGGGTTADLDAAVSASSNRELCVGGTSSTAPAYSGQIAELIFLKRVLTSDEDDALVAYLNTRYGTALTGVTQ